MTVECVLLPDGAATLPAEARDDAAVWSHLQSNEGNLSSTSPISAMREVVRVTEQDRMVLRMDGTLNDYTQTSLDAVTNALVNNINGLKVHPDGWQEVSTS